MCIEVTNTIDAAVHVIYSQWMTREIPVSEGAYQELVLPSGLSAVMVAEPQTTETVETRHRITIPPNDTLTIRYAATVEPQDGITTKPLPDYVEPLPEDGPL